MKQSIDRFLKYIESEKRYSAHTVTSYKNDLEGFGVYIESQYSTTEPSRANSSMVRSWLARLMQLGFASSTVNRKLSTLKSYYNYLSKNDIIDFNPMEKVRSVKKGKTVPTFIEETKMGLLLDSIPWPEGFKGARDRLIIELMYATGIRLSELCGLQHSDLDCDKKTIKVTGKRAKQRIVPVIDEVLCSYVHYCQFLKTELGVLPHDFMIVTNKGNKAYPKFVYKIVRTCLGQVTSSKKKSPHVLRHTFATHMLNKGADLNAIKEILGHSNLAATQIYTHNSIEKIKKVYKQAHPKA